MLRNLTLATRLLLSFGLLLVLLVAIGGSGYSGTKGVSPQTPEILQEDAKLAEHSTRALVNTLQLRRYAKDMFLNVDSPGKVAKYRKQWDEQDTYLTARLDDLDKYSTRQGDKELVRGMRKELAAYEAGSTRVFGLIQDGSIKTAQDANKAMTQYQGEIHRLESLDVFIGEVLRGCQGRKAEGHR